MQPSTESSCPWWGKIGLLWLILIPLFMAIYVLIQPLTPNDFWYHLRAGAWMVQHQSFPRVAMFTPSVPPGTPYFYQSWLGEIILYLTASWTGLAGSQILRAICFTSAVAIFIAAAQRRAKILLGAPGVDVFNDSARRVAIVGSFALFMSIPNTDLRPQTLSLPFFAIFAAVIFNWANTKNRHLIIRTICLIGLMAIWANTHGAFATGLILLLLFCIGETLHSYVQNPLSRLFGNRINKSQLKIVWVALGGSIIAACINPRGLAIYTYVYTLTSNTINKKHIQEWQPPHWSDGSNAVFFCCGIAIFLLALLIIARQKEQNNHLKRIQYDTKNTYGTLGLRPGEVLIIAAFFVMGLRSIRSILWFALLFIIVGTALICRTFPIGNLKIGFISPAIQKINALSAIIACLLVVPVLPYFKPLLPWPQSYLTQFSHVTSAIFPYGFQNDPPMLLSNNTPMGAALFLRKHPPQGLLWNDMVFGSYLAWALYPGQGPWADPRIELRPDTFWNDYLDTAQAKNKPSITLQQRGFSDVLIGTQEGNLKQNLQASPHWKIIYQDDASILYRTTLKNKN